MRTEEGILRPEYACSHILWMGENININVQKRHKVSWYVEKQREGGGVILILTIDVEIG